MAHKHGQPMMEADPGDPEKPERQELLGRGAGAIAEFVAFQEKWEDDPRPDPAPISKETERHPGLWPDGRSRQELPIDRRLEEIGGLLEQNQVVIVQAETGAGKTTRIAQHHLLTHPRRLIVMTEPRRNAVRWTGKRIAEETGSPAGNLVGWRLRGENPVVSRETRLTLLVDQSLINKIRRSGRLPEGLIVVDEAHERSIHTDLLLGMIKEGLSRSPNTKLLITSATIDTKKFAAFFGDAPVVSAEGRMFPVSTEVVPLQYAEHHTSGAARAARTVLERFAKGELKTPAADGAGEETATQGTVVVLLPGKEDIREVVESLEKSAAQLGISEKVEILSCHGESTPEEQDRVQKTIPPGTLRIVCGTEVLRSSVTLPETIGAIDSLQVKRMVSDAKGVGHLTKISVSKAEADQGKGRAGRTRPGFYMPVSFESEYRGLSPYPTPAILLQPVTSLALEVAAIGRSVRTFPLMDRPPEDKLETAITRLKRIGALDDQEHITDVGEFLVRFPVNPEKAKVLLAAEHLGVLPEAAIATGMMEAENVFFVPRREQKSCAVEEPVLRRILALVEYGPTDERWRRAQNTRDPATIDISLLPPWIKKEGQHWTLDTSDYSFEPPDGVRGVAEIVRKLWAGKEGGDFAALVRAYRAFKAEEQRLKRCSPPAGAKTGAGAWRDQELRAWCDRWFVNLKRMRAAEGVIRQIMDEIDASPLRMMGSVIADRPFDGTALTKALCAGLTDNIGVRRPDGRFTGPLVGQGTFLLSQGSACSEKSRFVIVGGVHKAETRARRGTLMHFADLAAPIQPEWLEEVMPQLCHRRREPDARYDPAVDRVMETEIMLYGDLELDRKQVPAPYTPENARRFAGWLASDQAPGQITSQPLQSILAENLVQQWRANELRFRAGISGPSSYFTNTLAELYLERIGAAARIAEIDNVEHLRIPPLDAETTERILREYPDAMLLFGHERKIHYDISYLDGGRSVAIPRVDLDNDAADNHWQELPDEGVRLPGGTPVRVSLWLGQAGKGGTWRKKFSGEDIPALKQEIFLYLNEPQWTAWKDRQSVPVPDLEDPHAKIPDLIEAPYGISVVDGATPLIAYGTLVENARRFSSLDPHFVTQWFPTRAQANQARETTVVHFENFREKSRIERERKQLLAEASAIRERLRDVVRRSVQASGNPIHAAARSAFESTERQFFPDLSNDQLTAWIRETRTIVTAAENAIAESESQADAVERRLRILARPISPPGVRLNQWTVYGMPCDADGTPCETKAAAAWYLYAENAKGKLAPREGAARLYAPTFGDLARTYYQDKSEGGRLFRSLALDQRDFDRTKSDPVLEAVQGNLERAAEAREFAETLALLGAREGVIAVLRREASRSGERAEQIANIQAAAPGINVTDIGRLFSTSDAAHVDELIRGALAYLDKNTKRTTAQSPSEPITATEELSPMAQAFRAAEERAGVTEPPPKPLRKRDGGEPKPKAGAPAAPERARPPESREEITALIERDLSALRAMSAGPRPAEGSSRSAGARIKEHEGIEARLRELRREGPELLGSVARSTSEVGSEAGRAASFAASVRALAGRIERFGGPAAVWLDSYRAAHDAIPQLATENEDVHVAVELGTPLLQIITRARELFAADAAQAARGEVPDPAETLRRAADELAR